MKFFRSAGFLVAVLVALTACCEPANGADRNRHNLFDPIFGFDEIDAHTVSAGQSTNSRQPKQEGSRTTRQQNQAQLFKDEPSESPALSRSSSRVLIESATGEQSENKKAATRQSGLSSTQNVAATPSFNIPVEESRTARRVSEPPRHWSALENYYQKLRQSALTNVQQQQQHHIQANNYQPIYQVLQQQEADDSLSAYKPLNSLSGREPYSSSSSSSGLGSIISNTQQKLAGAGSASKNPAFFLELLSSLPPNSDPDFGFSVHQNSAPGISRTGGIGSASVLSSVQPPSSYLSTLANTGGNYQTKSWQTSSSLPPATLVGALPNSQLDDGAKYLEWRRLPEMLLIQQQQQRIKHQQETFGDWYDHQRSRELLQEEAYCGPRNYLANLVARSDSAALLEPNEYPSHMGVYNGSAPVDNNYLCAATWIHEQFALTLASCLRGTDLKKLVVRAGEWNINKNNTGNSERTTALNQVEQVSVFPKYRSDSPEHDLAILKFSKPLDYLPMARLCPACQVQSRSSIRATSCWAPVRNITVSEYFDADGEGETKERKSVSMVDVPVKLIASDNNECHRQTKMEFFNFQHPNFICSADFKSNLWRARLNQTDYFGSGIYCNEGGNLSLVSILHPIHSNSSSAYGFMDLSYYRPWMRNVISGRSF